MKFPPDWTGAVLFVSDTQYPYIDWKAWACAKEIARSLRPELLILGGDGMDFDGFSRKFQHTVPAERRAGGKVRHECEEFGALLDDLRSAARPKHAIYLGGNHDDRVLKYIREILPILDGAVRVEEWLGLEHRRWQYIPYENGNGQIHVGDRYEGMTFLHGYRYSGAKKKDAGLAALLHIDKIGVSVCHGHTNRCVSVVRGRVRRKLWGLEAGCLCDAEAMARQYQPDPDLQHGVGYVVIRRGRVIHAEAIRISDGEALVPAETVRGVVAR